MRQVVKSKKLAAKRSTFAKIASEKMRARKAPPGAFEFKQRPHKVVVWLTDEEAAQLDELCDRHDRSRVDLFRVILHIAYECRSEQPGPAPESRSDASRAAKVATKLSPEIRRMIDAVNRNPKMCYVEDEDVLSGKVVLYKNGSVLRNDHDPPMIERPNGDVTAPDLEDFGYDLGDGGGMWGDGD